MLSAVIPSERGQPAVPLAGQLAHQRFVRPGPLVLGTALLKYPTRTADRDRTVSRRSKPSSRTALMGEQPNPWDRLQPQDATSRHRAFPAVSSGADYISTLLDQKSEGSACCDSHKFARCTNCHRGIAPQSLRGHLRKRFVKRWSRFRQTSHGIARPRQSREGEGFTFISRFHYGISAVSPQIEVPNRAVDVNSWAR